MRKRKYVIRTISIIVALIIITSTVVFCQNNCFIQNSHNSWRIRNFYREPEKSLDVLIVGSSEVFSGYIPGLAYDKYHFTSYPIATDSASIILWKCELEEILKYHQPKAILFEISGALYDDDKQIFDDSSLRRYSDNIPLSISKINMLSNQKLQDDILSYYFPWIKYHGDIENAKAAFSEKKYYDSIGVSRLKGIFTYSDIDLLKSEDVHIKSTGTLNANSKNYLYDFLNYIKEKNIENVVFVRFPHKVTNQLERDLVSKKNSVKEIVTEYGYDFWDLVEESENIPLDDTKDYYNSLHLNIYGAEKTTDYICNLLKAKCNSIGSSEKPENVNENWGSCVVSTKKFILYTKQKIAEGKADWLTESKELFDEID